MTFMLQHPTRRRLGAILLQLLLLLTWGSASACAGVPAANAPAAHVHRAAAVHTTGHAAVEDHAQHDAHAALHMRAGATATGAQLAGDDAERSHSPASCDLMMVCATAALAPGAPVAPELATAELRSAPDAPIAELHSVGQTLEPPPPRA